MRNWHPVSKFVVGVGIVALVGVWWIDQGSKNDSGSASRQIGQTAGIKKRPAVLIRNSDATKQEKFSPGMALKIRVLPPEGTFTAMVERPLFASNRRPFDRDVEVFNSGPTVPAFRFIGSIEEEGRLRGLVSDGFNMRAVAEGEAIDGWVVLSIETRRLALGHDDERLELRIFE